MSFLRKIFGSKQSTTSPVSESPTSIEKPASISEGNPLAEALDAGPGYADQQLADSEYWSIRVSYAKDPHADPKILERLIRNDPTNEVREAACMNPNTPTKVLEEFGGFKTSSPITEMIKMVQKPGGVVLWEKIAANPNTPARILERLASLNTPDSRLQKLSPRDWDYYKHIEEIIKWAVAENPNAPAKTLEALSKNQEWRVRIRVAENRNTPIHLLESLSKDENEDVRKRVAENRNTPIHSLESLLKDENEDVRDSVKENLSYRRATIQQGMSEVQRLIDIVLNVSNPDERGQALKTISQLPNRDEIIPILMDLFHKKEYVYSVVAVLKSIGTPATFDPLLEVFRSAEPGQLIDDGIRVTHLLIRDSGFAYQQGNDAAPAKALVELNPSLEKIKSKCSPDEFERILLLAIEPYEAQQNPLIYNALVELATPRAIGFLISTMGNSIENSREEAKTLAKQALISLGESALPRIRKAIPKPYNYTPSHDSRAFYEKCNAEFRKELDEILTAITQPD